MKSENQVEKTFSLISEKLFGKNLFSNKNLTEEEETIVNYIKSHKRKYFTQEPVPDHEVLNDNKNFVFKLPDSICELYVDFSLFSQKVKYYKTQGYDLMYFYFVELNDDLINLLSISENKDMISRLKNDLYIIVRFQNSSNGNVADYAIFNVRYAERNSKFLSGRYLEQFENSETGKKIKDISKDKLITWSIKYDLTKVSEYIEKLDEFSKDFNTTINKIEFTYCLGEKLTDSGGIKERFYLVSLPANSRGPISFFPYYDQGSLEP